MAIAMRPHLLLVLVTITFFWSLLSVDTSLACRPPLDTPSAPSSAVALSSTPPMKKPTALRISPPKPGLIALHSASAPPTTPTVSNSNSKQTLPTTGLTTAPDSSTASKSALLLIPNPPMPTALRTQKAKQPPWPAVAAIAPSTHSAPVPPTNPTLNNSGSKPLPTTTLSTAPDYSTASKSALLPATNPPLPTALTTQKAKQPPRPAVAAIAPSISGPPHPL